MEKTEDQSRTDETVEGADASVEKTDSSVEDISVEGVAATDANEGPKNSDPVGQRPIYNIQTSLDPTLDIHLKRVSFIAIGAVFLCVIMMMVTGGRLASEVDNLQAATLSLTKRVVNMNSGLERFSVLDSRFELLDLGQASILDGNTELRLANSEMMGVVSEEVSKLSNALDEQLVNVKTLAAQMSSITEGVAEQEKSMDSLTDRFERLERQRACSVGHRREAVGVCTVGVHALVVMPHLLLNDFLGRTRQRAAAAIGAVDHIARSTAQAAAHAAPFGPLIVPRQGKC